MRWPKKNSTHCPGWVDHYKHAFKPDLDGTTSAKPASPPPERFKLAPLGSVVRKKECATSSLPDEQSSCAALEFCTDCAQ
ncbi:hypothetical protein BM547_29870 [Pseudomonas aeruginosa]|nr:hypothetical protein BM547_29870 [Pseudomonas aeruginosa]